MCVCVFVCGCVGMQDRRSAGRDKCSNLSSPSHSHPSAQTSKSLPLGLPRTHTQAHTHTCEHTHTHRSLISTLSPTPISVFTVIPNPKQRHTWRQKRKRRMDSQCHSTALCQDLLIRCRTQVCTYRALAV